LSTLLDGLVGPLLWPRNLGPSSLDFELARWMWILEWEIRKNEKTSKLLAGEQRPKSHLSSTSAADLATKDLETKL
jgi:hypothetical protein